MKPIQSKSSRSMGMQRAAAGLSVSEYALIAALVLVCSISGVGLLGKALHQHWGSFGESLSPKTAQSPQTPDSQAPEPRQTSPSIPGKQLDILMKSGQMVHVSGYPENLMKSVQTLGANGATKQLADTLIALADSLKASGEITESEHDLLMQLANQGHYLGKLEGLIENTSKQFNASREFMNTKVQLDGQSYTLTDISNQYGWADNNPDVNNIESAYPATRAFIELRNQVLQEVHVQSTPAVKAIVEELSGNILNLAKASSLSIQSAPNSGSNINVYTAYQLNMDVQFSSQGVSKLTHTDSGGICTIGRGQDTGIQCH